MPRRRSFARVASLVALPVVLLAVRAFAAPDSPCEPRVTLAPGHGVVTTLGPDGPRDARVVDLAAPLRLLVGFDAPPALRSGADRAARERATRISAERASRLDVDLAALAAGVRAPDGGPARVQVTRTYSQVWSGAAITVEPSLRAAVRALPYVRGVWTDDSVHADLDESVPLIRADQVQRDLGGDGNGVRVGIVDTGVDYANPALGGGFGPGHRVAGGWDFANDDADPMDDHGHGTHVAGIVGAYGFGLVGVAPRATLYAFKVLNGGGNGLNSWVLAGLERVLDPDGDPLTDDGCQVINVSLGSAPSAMDDPLTQAIDALAAADVVCCVAAGNRGGPWQVQSPGIAAGALTVGATDKLDQLAAFSSRGPLHGSFAIKPDLVAPGVAIRSLALAGGTVAMSGTSMATPHVAGVAAQLRQLHPGWSADEVKAAIIGTTVALPYPPYEAGSGRLDAWNAATTPIVLEPPSLAFGRVSPSTPGETRSRTLTVRNLTASALNVQLVLGDDPAPGAHLSVEPAVVTVGAFDSAVAVVRLDVDNRVLSPPALDPYGLAGSVTATAAGHSVRAAITVHSCAVLTVDTNDDAWTFMAQDRTSNRHRFEYSLWAPFALPSGHYDLLAAYFTPWMRVFHVLTQDDVTVNDSTHVVFDTTTATTKLRFRPVDADGVPATPLYANVYVLHEGTSTGAGFAGFTTDEIGMRPTTGPWRIEWAQHDTDHRSYAHIFSGTERDFSASRTITNAASDVRRLHLHVPATASDSNVVAMFDMLGVAALGTAQAFGTIGFGNSFVTGPMTFDLQYTPSPEEWHVQTGAALQLLGVRNGEINVSFPQFVSPVLRFDRGWPIEVYDDDSMQEPWGTFGGTDLDFGRSLPVWRGGFTNSAGVLHFDPTPQPLHPFVDELGAMVVEPDPLFTLRQGGVPVLSDTLTGAGGIVYGELPMVTSPVPGDVDFETSHAYTLRGRSGLASVVAHLRLEQPDRDPPRLHSLQLLADGVPADSIAFATAKDPRLHFRVTDGGPFTAQAWVGTSPASSASWQPLGLARTGDAFAAALPPSLDGVIALKLVATDTTGNALTLTWDPAFVATFGADPPPLPTPALALLGARPNPIRDGVVSLACTLASLSNARLALYDVTGREVVTQDFAVTHTGAQTLAFGPGTHLRPGLYFARLTQDRRTVHARVVVIR